MPEKFIEPPERVMNGVWAFPSTGDCLHELVELWPKDFKMKSWFPLECSVRLQQQGRVIGTLGGQSLKEAGRETLLLVKRNNRAVELDQRGMETIITPGVRSSMHGDLATPAG